VSSAAGRPPYGGIGGLIRGQVEALVRIDPATRYALCYKLSRWRKGDLFRPRSPNACVRVLLDPLNGMALRRAHLLHAMSSWLPRLPGVPRLFSVYDLSHVRNPQWVTPHHRERRLAALRAAVGGADHVVACSEYTAHDVCDAFGLPLERVHSVLPGVDAEAFRPLPAEALATTRDRHGDYVLAIGLLTPRKNFPALVAAVSRLRGMRLVVVGGKSNGSQEFFDAVDQHGMRQRVDHLEGVPHDGLVRLVNAARAFCVPSLFEGFGLIVLEAMACGAPVVCSDATSLPEAAGDAALLVEASKIDALVEGLRRVIEDGGLAARLRERGLARARAMSWERSANELRALYRRVGGK
jgi:alpha-1,3-rhamnosyl/mannosyltransferase